MAVSYRTATRTTRMTTIATDVSTSAQIKVYNGTAPANVGAALSGNTLLATLTGNATQFGTVSGAVLTFSAVTAATAVATGTPTFVRVATSGGTDIFQADAGVGSGSFNFAASITSGSTVSLTSGTITEGNP